MRDRSPGCVKRHRIRPLVRSIVTCPPVAVRGEQFLRHRRQWKEEPTERISQPPLAGVLHRRSDVTRTQRPVPSPDFRQIGLPRTHPRKLAPVHTARRPRSETAHPPIEALSLSAVSRSRRPPRGQRHFRFGRSAAARRGLGQAQPRCSVEAHPIARACPARYRLPRRAQLDRRAIWPLVAGQSSSPIESCTRGGSDAGRPSRPVRGRTRAPRRQARSG
jgi:hypothetical protein